MTPLLRCLTLCLVLPVAAAAPPAPAAPATPAAAKAPVVPGGPGAPVVPVAPGAPGAPVVPAEPAAPGVPGAAETDPAKAKPALVQLDADRFKIGDVEFSKQTRVIRFPAVINMRDGLLEYVLVTGKGKVHEALLRTTINATHLNIVLKLLRYQDSPELFSLRNEDGSPSGRYPVVDAKTKAAARVELRMIWQGEQQEQSASINELIARQPKNRPMPPGPWIYSGSVVYEGRFLAEQTGDLIAIQIDQGAIFNCPGANRDNDEVWLPVTKRLPAVDAPVTFEIRPWPPATKPAP